MVDPENDEALGRWFEALAQWDSGRVGPALEDVLAYGSHPEQVIDRWGPMQPRDAAVILLHGGYFLGEFGRDLQNTFARACAALGLAVYNVEYRREGCGGDLETTTGDVRAAIDFLVAERGVRRISVIGHSAGGYLALTLVDHPAVELVVALGAVCDLAATVRSGLDEGAVVRWLGAHPDGAKDIYASSDLMNRNPVRARQVLVHGVEDRVVDISQSRAHARKAHEREHEVELIELTGEGHFCFLDPREEAFETALAPVEAWWSAVSSRDAAVGGSEP